MSVKLTALAISGVSHMLILAFMVKFSIETVGITSATIAMTFVVSVVLWMGCKKVAGFKRRTKRSWHTLNMMQVVNMVVLFAFWISGRFESPLVGAGLILIVMFMVHLSMGKQAERKNVS